MRRDRLLILDGHGLIFRAIFRPGAPLTAPNGEPTRGTFTFCKTLFALIDRLQPDYLVMAGDAPRKSTFRRALYPPYKAGRPGGDDGPPKEVVVQLARCQEITRLLGIPIVTVPTFEADDVIATLVSICAGPEVECIVASRDKDMHQLASKDCRLYDPVEQEWFDVDRITERWGVPPEQIVEIMTLAGDPTDGVPGVKGIGLKKALKLINTHKTARAAARHCGFGEDHVALMRQLVELRRDVPISISPKELEFNGLQRKNVRQLFQQLGFNSLL